VRPFSSLRRSKPINPELWAWTGFIAFVLVVLAIDLGVLNRKAHVVSIREALRFTAAVFVLALMFNALVYLMYENHWLGSVRT